MRYLIYARFSPRRDAATCPSTDVQLADLCRWVSDTNPEAEILEFRDDDTSGKTYDRTGLKAALDTLKRGDILLVRDWDRLARDLYVQLKIARIVTKKQAGLRAINGGNWRDVNDPAIELLSNIMASYAQYQRAMISKKTSQKMRQHQANGRYMGGNPPFGMRVKEDGGVKKLIPIPAEQETIQRIIELRDQRQFRWKQIACTLGNEGRKINGSRIWAANVVRRVYIRQKQRPMESSRTTPEPSRSAPVTWPASSCE
jgi:DNA invertase Pin-like site-specific DNA recombinase